MHGSFLGCHEPLFPWEKCWWVGNTHCPLQGWIPALLGGDVHLLSHTLEHHLEILTFPWAAAGDGGKKQFFRLWPCLSFCCLPMPCRAHPCSHKTALLFIYESRETPVLPMITNNTKPWGLNVSQIFSTLSNKSAEKII